MRFFEKWNRTSNRYLIASAIFGALTVVLFALSGFASLLRANYANDLRGIMMTVICFLCFLFSLLTGLSLKQIRQETIDEVRQLENRIIRLEKEKE
ncbi:hypothetical protein [Saccharibacillus alkalitolerans]|uniref:YiaAB two helix domain-containing protein n=1 Tax=Saccharibacillus alkalitolerans TaxID=2705290 RepID=A0ABX0FBL2_9BACL|nr:hypothetical protein [Saccharibacillus alkalitolerans]NGZ77668.1 hypothetical protein [Saccharibacillus alkalitolerans]